MRIHLFTNMLFASALTLYVGVSVAEPSETSLLEQGYGEIALCNPIAEAGAIGNFQCGQGTSITSIDGDAGGKSWRRDRVFVRPGRHAVTVMTIHNGEEKTYYIQTEAGRRYMASENAERNAWVKEGKDWVSDDQTYSSAEDFISTIIHDPAAVKDPFGRDPNLRKWGELIHLHIPSSSYDKVVARAKGVLSVRENREILKQFLNLSAGQVSGGDATSPDLLFAKIMDTSRGLKTWFQVFNYFMSATESTEALDAFLKTKGQAS